MSKVKVVVKTKAVELDVVSFKRLIAKKALESWYKLPPKTRAYVDVEDMIQDGIMYAKFSLLPKYNPKRAKFSTLLYQGLENHYRRSAELLNAKKRFDGEVEMLEDLASNGFEPSKEENIELCQHVVTMFLNVYWEASDSLRESMRRWFLQSSITKVHRAGYRFKKDRDEFRVLAKKYQLDANDCRFIMNSSLCQTEIFVKLPENNVRDLNVGKDISVRVMSRAF